MKSAKDLLIPFTWRERRPILLDRFFYIPSEYSYSQEVFSFFVLQQPVIIEYCSGNGQWVGDQARQNPHCNWIAVEKKFERARTIWLKMQREPLSNLCVVCGDALIFTHYYAPPAREAYINFPDPWPKRRHAKRRLIKAEFLQAILRIVVRQGKVTCVTDDPIYAKEILQEFEKCSDWKFLFHRNEWPSYGGSFFKDLWIGKGRAIHYITYEKNHV